MKTGVAFYYKNIEQYNPAWVNKCIESMRSQTHKDFDVYVLNYGEHEKHNFNFKIGNRYHFLHKPLVNHAAAINEIYSWIFETCDVAVNTNIDDYYSKARLEFLLRDLENGADIASCNMHIVDEKNIIRYSPVYSSMNIYGQLKNGFNPISNPAHVMKKRVFQQLKFDTSLMLASDMDYWKRALAAGFKIVINTRFMHYYRFHQGQATHKLNFGNKLSVWNKLKNIYFNTFGK
jgi:hypothetical protein